MTNSTKEAIIEALEIALDCVLDGHRDQAVAVLTAAGASVFLATSMVATMTISSF